MLREPGDPTATEPAACANKKSRKARTVRVCEMISKRFLALLKRKNEVR
jgi:hypothetical protein